MGIDKPRIDRDALKQLRTHPFSGNVRELENILERAVALCDENLIRAQDLGLPDVDATPGDVSEVESTPDGLAGQDLEQYLADVEKQAIVQALEATRWNRTAAAKKLGISFRALRYRLEKLGLD
jgi:two-component system response regulator PilR (NtrC family)